MKKERLTQVGKIILSSLIAGSVISLAVIAPNIFSIWGKLYPNRRKFGHKQFNNHLKYLQQKQLINIIEKEDDISVEITENGKKRALQFKIDDIKIKKPTKWDGKWRAIIFDIPEKKRLARDILRDKLKELGFIKLQKSVWIYPYECKDEIDYIKEVYSIGHYVTYLLVDKYDYDYRIKSYFGLQK